MSESSVTLHRGVVLHVHGCDLECFEDGLLAVGKDRRILEVGPWEIEKKYPEATRVDHAGKLLVPGFVDAHVHLPQYPFAGLGAEELLPWLEKYTFPMESRFAAPDFARQATATFFDALLKVGTTTACLFATSSTQATRIAFEEAERRGVRAIIGKVLMERYGPDALLEPWQIGLRGSEELAEEWHGRDGRLFFAVTPRFAITCSQAGMVAAGELARRRSLYIQTHLSESPAEVGLVERLFPECDSYTNVYERYGLLSDKTLLAHCLHLSPAEVRSVVAAGSVMTHCPTSNRYLQSGVFSLRLMEESGARMALGSDVAGGFELAMLHEMREAVESSKVWNIHHREQARQVLSVPEAFRMATLGGAEALGLDGTIGNFVVGKEADFLVLDDSDVNSFSTLSCFQTGIERLTRLVYRGRWPVSRTYVRGQVRYSRSRC